MMFKLFAGKFDDIDRVDYHLYFTWHIMICRYLLINYSSCCIVKHLEKKKQETI